MRKEFLLALLAGAVTLTLLCFTVWVLLEPETPRGTAPSVKQSELSLLPIVGTGGDEQEDIDEWVNQSHNKVIIPSVNHRSDLLTITTKNGELTPPTFTHSYQVTDIGTDTNNPAGGTVYVIAHSCTTTDCVANNLFNRATGETKVHPGENIYINGVTYTVETTHTTKKTALPYDRNVWTNTPNRLVFITCLQTPTSSPSTENFIIIATIKGDNNE